MATRPAERTLWGEALEVACRSGHASCADLLLKAGADPDHVVQRGEQRHWRPIHSTAAAGSTECTELLLLAGADACAVDSSDAVALSSACGVETIRLLLEEAPQAARMLDSEANTPVMSAIQAGRCDEALWMVALAPLQPPAALVHRVAQSAAALSQEGQMEQQLCLQREWMWSPFGGCGAQHAAGYLSQPAAAWPSGCRTRRQPRPGWCGCCHMATSSACASSL